MAEEIKEEIKIEIQRILDYEKLQKYYANCSMMSSSIYDFALIFGTFHVEDNKKVVEKYEHIVYMGPQQAKALFNLFKDQISKYEKNWGEIKVLEK